MLTFRRLKLEDFETIKPFFEYSITRTCDNTVGGAILWRDFFKVEYTIWQQSLIFKVDYFGVTAFPMPLGGDYAAALEEIRAYCRAAGIPMVICTAAAGDVARIKALYRVELRPEPDWGDYLYLTEDLAAMSGRRYHGQRNHINFFMKTNPDYAIEPITAENLPDVRDFFSVYRAGPQKDSALFREEQEKVGELLERYEQYRQEGLALRAGGRIIAFAIGEVLGDTYFVHIEKTDQSVRGANQMMAMSCARHYLDKGVRYVNREEDVGDPGLRTSKLSYHPHIVLEKFTVTILE